MRRGATPAHLTNNTQGARGELEPEPGPLVFEARGEAEPEPEPRGELLPRRKVDVARFLELYEPHTKLEPRQRVCACSRALVRDSKCAAKSRLLARAEQHSPSARVVIRSYRCFSAVASS